MKQRNTTMDVAKAIALLAVIFGHTKYDDTVRLVLYTFHLPVFFIITGYFFSMKDSFFQFLIKKTKAYILPYISFALIILFFNYWHYDYRRRVFEYNREHFILQQRYTTLWFLTSLFFAVILFRLICFICRQRSEIILALCLLISSIATYYTKQESEPLRWNFDISCIILIYLAVGYILRKHRVIEYTTKTRRRAFAYLLGCGFIAAILTKANLLVTNGEYFELFHNHFGCYPLTTVAALAASFSIFMLAHFLRNVKPLVSFGQNTMVYFALHQSIALVYAKEWCKPLSPWLGKTLLLFAITLALCFVFDRIIQNSPLKFIVGH